MITVKTNVKNSRGEYLFVSCSDMELYREQWLRYVYFGEKEIGFVRFEINNGKMDILTVLHGVGIYTRSEDYNWLLHEYLSN